MDVRKKHCSTETVEQWHIFGGHTFANRQEQAGNKGMLPSGDQPLPMGVKNSPVLNAFQKTELASSNRRSSGSGAV
jgi:hypothetical protein